MRPRFRKLSLASFAGCAILALACGKAERALDSSASDMSTASASRPRERPTLGFGQGGGVPTDTFGGTLGVIAGAPAAAPQAPAAEVNAAVRTTGVEQSLQTPLPGSMLVRTGQASVQVDSLERGIARVREIARRTGAVIANTSMEGGKQNVRTASLELRVPSERFDEAVNGLAPIGKVEAVNVTAADVGEEYVDIQARVANARRLEERLIALLANRTGKLSDVLNVERELARVREEIERYEGRLRYLRTRASISTLTVAVHEPFPVVATRPDQNPIAEAFVQAWRNLVGITAGLIASLGVIVPVGLLILGGVLVAKKLGVGRRESGTGIKEPGIVSEG